MFIFDIYANNVVSSTLYPLPSTLYPLTLMPSPPLCQTIRYQPHVLAGSFSRRLSGRRAPGKPHPYGSYPWYSTWMVDQGPFRVREVEGAWLELEGPVAVVLPPYSGDRIDLPVSTLFSWVEWGVVNLRRIPRTGGGPAGKYLPGKEQPSPQAVWGVELPLLVPDSLLEATRTMLFRVNTLWWRTPFHHLQANAELARWLSQLVLSAADTPTDGTQSFAGLQEEVKVLKDALGQGVGIREWAALVGIHPRTLHRRCLETLNRTPHQVLSQVRLERAEELLLQPDVTVPVIAHNCGFANREAFSRWFVKERGMAPVQWRKRLMEG